MKQNHLYTENNLFDRRLSDNGQSSDPELKKKEGVRKKESACSVVDYQFYEIVVHKVSLLVRATEKQYFPMHFWIRISCRKLLVN